jgi:hypothetical protein
MTHAATASALIFKLLCCHFSYGAAVLLQASGVHNPITTEAECRAGIAAVEVCAARMESARAQASLTLHYITLCFIVYTTTLLTKSYIAGVLHTVSTS